MRIAFIWWWERANEIYPYWRDGLKAAIEVIGESADVDLYLGEYKPEEDYDFILFWGDSNCPFFDGIENYKGKKGICLTTDPVNFDNLRKLDVVYCESDPIYNAVRSQGIRAIKAFGTDTDFYTPNESVKKDILAFYPATFSPWKRQSEIANLGDKLYCVGTVQPDGQEELEACKKAGVNVAVGYFKAEHIRDLYQRAQQVYIPAIHGSERTCLEAMASDIIPIVNPNNHRTHSYITEFLRSGYESPREFVVDNYSHKKYAKDLLKGMEE